MRTMLGRRQAPPKKVQGGVQKGKAAKKPPAATKKPAPPKKTEGVPQIKLGVAQSMTCELAPGTWHDATCHAYVTQLLATHCAGSQATHMTWRTS